MQIQPKTLASHGPQGFRAMHVNGPKGTQSYNAQPKRGCPRGAQRFAGVLGLGARGRRLQRFTLASLRATRAAAALLATQMPWISPAELQPATGHRPTPRCGSVPNNALSLSADATSPRVCVHMLWGSRPKCLSPTKESFGMSQDREVHAGVE